MDDLLRELTEPFGSLSDRQAGDLLRGQWGIEANDVDRLDTERDDSFRVTSGEREYVLKVAHPSDSPALIALQVAAMRRAGAAGLPVQLVVPTVDGRDCATVDGRVARLLSWIPGDLLHTVDYGLTEVHASGSMLARLAVALRDLDQPAAHRTFAWDLRSFSGLREHAHPGLTDVFDRVDSAELGGLPQQLIHNDFNPGNLLVRHGTDEWIVGILDFGDALHAARVQDLAVALAYLVPEQGDPQPTITAFVAGYESVTRLRPEELAVLPILIAARLVQRMILPPLIYPDDVEPDQIERRGRTLENLLRAL